MVTEGQQLPAVPAGAGAAHRVPAGAQRAVPPRPQAHAHRPQAGEHPVPRLGLRGAQPAAGRQEGITRTRLRDGVPFTTTVIIIRVSTGAVH